MHIVNSFKGEQARNHKDYQICKSFLNLWLQDSHFQLNQVSYFQQNYHNFSMVMGHAYAPPSFCFQFPLKRNNNQKQSDLTVKTKDKCYHGTSATLINKIVNKGLRAPNALDIVIRNGGHDFRAIYTTKIPEHAQIFAEPYYWQGHYFQTILLVQQDISKLEWSGQVDLASSRYYQEIYTQILTKNMRQIHNLHSRILQENQVQWGTKDEKSLKIEAVIIKMHDRHPYQGQYRMISQMLHKK